MHPSMLVSLLARTRGLCASAKLLCIRAAALGRQGLRLKTKGSGAKSRREFEDISMHMHERAVVKGRCCLAGAIPRLDGKMGARLPLRRCPRKSTSKSTWPHQESNVLHARYSHNSSWQSSTACSAVSYIASSAVLELIPFPLTAARTPNHTMIAQTTYPNQQSHLLAADPTHNVRQISRQPAMYRPRLSVARY